MIDRRLHLRFLALGSAALALVCAAIPARAQYEDDVLDEHERQDQRYLERYRQQEEQPQNEVETDGPPRAEAFIAQADELIRDKNYRSFDTDRFRVQTDDPRVDPEAAASLLDGFHDFFTEFWRDTLELQPQTERSRVFLFYSFYKYNQLLSGDWRFCTMRPKGHYVDDVHAITLHTDSAAASDLADVLVHETTHLLFDERLLTKDHSMPTWLTEGLASYFGFTYMDDQGRFHAGEIGGKKVALMRGARAEAGREGKQRLTSLKKQMKSRTEGPGIVDVIRIRDSAEFYSRPDWSYAASWVLVHFLFHGDEGAHREGFSRYLERARLEESGPEALLRELGMGGDELEIAAAHYLKRLKAH